MSKKHVSCIHKSAINYKEVGGGRVEKKATPLYVSLVLKIKGKNHPK